MKVLSIILSAVFAFSSSAAVFASESTGNVKNIIYMIPDGGGMTPFNLADAVKQAGGWEDGVFPNATKSEAGEMYFKQYLVGAITTKSADSDVTDSAAAGTALSSGYKTNNNTIGIDPDKKPHANILEAAQYLGKNVGMVTTYEWSNATPAAFSAHEKDRGIYSTISEQVVNQGIDVVLGVGFGAAKWGDISEAEIRGYDIINSMEDLENVKAGDKIWGNLEESSFSYDIEKNEKTPSIADMTKAAITALDDGEDGFFLMVEGSRIDGGGHSNYALGMTSDFLAFDEACRVAFEYANGRDDTVVVVCPDHDTGGMILPDDIENAVSMLKQGKEPDDIVWETTAHTARNGGLFMYVPEGVNYPSGISGKNIGTEKAYEENVIDNTAIAPYLAELMDVSLEDVTNELFVDVTEMGTYDKMGVFKFTDYPACVMMNTSYAFVGNDCVDLAGQIAFAIGNNIYVPQLLLDIVKGTKKAEICPYGIPVKVNLTSYMPNSLDITKWNGRFKISNFLTDAKLSGKIRFTEPEAFAALEPVAISVDGQDVGTYDVEYPHIDVDSNGMEFKYELILDDGTKYEYTTIFKGFAYAGYVDEEIKIDGVLDEEAWKNSVVMTCDDVDKLYLNEDEYWKGERDLSADFSILWDDKYYYMSAVVTDETFCQNQPVGNNMWNGDSVQIGLYNDKENAILSGTAGRKYEKFTVAWVEDGVPAAFRHLCLDGKTSYGLLENGEDFEMACTRVGDDMIYELKMSWSEIFGESYVPKKGNLVGFAALINDSDGGDRRAYMEYGGGMGSPNDANRFVVMPLLDFQKKADEIEIFINGEKVKTDVEPVIVDDRTLLPIRVVAEKMGYDVVWDAKEKSVSIESEETNTRLQFIINSDVALKNATQTIGLDVPAMIIKDRTCLPLRAVAEALGADVSWNEDERKVEITY